MPRMDILAVLIAVVILSGCAQSRWDAAYSVVDTGTPIDMESDF